MGLITEEVEIVLHPMNINYYENLGYKIPRRKDKWGDLTVPKGTTIIVKTTDLTSKSSVFIDVMCDCCGITIKDIKWYNYTRYIKEDGKYYCKKCASNLYGTINAYQTKLKNGKSFQQWCIDNNRQDILDRWDYDLNNCKPNEITYSTGKKYYFKCPRGIHFSELKLISNFTSGQEGCMLCNKCNSFAQYLLDNFGENALDKYWSNINEINPWGISLHYSKKVWIKCQEKDYHDSYEVTPDSFVGRDARCPYCVNRKIHPLDSLGKLLEKNNLLNLWSNKNIQSPYKYSPMSNQDVYWKCPKGLHEDFHRKISNSNIANFRCPECQYSRGEEAISNYFINKGLLKIDDKDYKILDNVFKEKHDYYIPQKEFEGLVGLGGGLLSYDFYIPKFNLNLLIEYQGEQHERYIPGFHKSKKDFKKQVEHDRRKKEYAIQNGYNFLEIWYYDFDKIEEILDEYLNNKEIKIIKLN